jgi:hypothetical protein
MVRPVVKDIFFLNQKSEPATKADSQVVPFVGGCQKHNTLSGDRGRVF